MVDEGLSQIDASSPERTKIRVRARELCLRLNSCANSKEKQDICEKLFLKMGKGSEVWSNFFCEFGVEVTVNGSTDGGITLGENVFIHANCTINDTFKVNIQDEVSIGPNVYISTSKLPEEVNERVRYKEVGDRIIVGRGSEICSGAKILPGAKIGERCYIGSNSVVSTRVVIGNDCYIGDNIIVNIDLPDGSQMKSTLFYKFKNYLHLYATSFFNKFSTAFSS